jgi:hypothetical protein
VLCVLCLLCLDECRRRPKVQRASTISGLPNRSIQTTKSIILYEVKLFPMRRMPRCRSRAVEIKECDRGTVRVCGAFICIFSRTVIVTVVAVVDVRVPDPFYSIALCELKPLYESQRYNVINSTMH